MVKVQSFLDAAVALGAGLLVMSAATGCSGERENPLYRELTSTLTVGSGGSSIGGGGGAAGYGGDGGGSAVTGGGGGGAGGPGGSGGSSGWIDENCFDGVDNDGDMLSDCLDTDCTVACSDTCGAPVVITSPVSLTGDSTGHAERLEPSCPQEGSGPEVAYQLLADTTGILEISLQSDAELGLSVRTACAEQTSEIGCADHFGGAGARERLWVPVTSGETVYIIVDGTEDGDFGPYVIDVLTRPIACGDGKTDPPLEQCDDGGSASGDGCSSACTVETIEQEPTNDSAWGADDYVGPWYAALWPLGGADTDFIAFEVSEASATVVVQIHDFGDGACATHRLDSVVQLLDGATETVLATDDDSGEGSCSRLQLNDVDPGNYLVQVMADPAAQPNGFGYLLDIVVSPGSP